MGVKPVERVAKRDCAAPGVSHREVRAVEEPLVPKRVDDGLERPRLANHRRVEVDLCRNAGCPTRVQP